MRVANVYVLINNVEIDASVYVNNSSMTFLLSDPYVYVLRMCQLCRCVVLVIIVVVVVVVVPFSSHPNLLHLTYLDEILLVFKLHAITQLKKRARGATAKSVPYILTYLDYLIK